MLANAQTDMEAGLKKMQLAKKIAQTKINNDKAANLKKKNTDLTFGFVTTQVWYLVFSVTLLFRCLWT